MANYCTQCTDTKTGVIGDFLYCETTYKETKKFIAISPVFTGLIEFFKWAKDNGVVLRHHG